MSTHGIEEPVVQALAKVLRRAVREHAAAEPRRVFAAALHAGFPGGEHRALELDPAWDLDATLRIDMIEAMARHHLAQGRVPLLWITRPADELAATSDDLAWAAAAKAAGRELRVTLDLVVVTRHSWLDPRTGVGRFWQRTRHRRAAPSGAGPNPDPG